MFFGNISNTHMNSLLLNLNTKSCKNYETPKTNKKKEVMELMDLL